MGGAFIDNGSFNIDKRIVVWRNYTWYGLEQNKGSGAGGRRQRLSAVEEAG
jgi:hypothetical protein